MGRPRSLATQLARCRVQDGFVEDWIFRNGLAKLDPDTNGGRQVAELVRRFELMASAKVPDAVRVVGVDACVKGTLIQNIGFNQIKFVGPIPMGASKADAAIRSAQDTALKYIGLGSRMVERGLRILGVEGFAPGPTRLDHLNAYYAELEDVRSKAVEAPFQEGGAKTPETSEEPEGAVPGLGT